MSSKIVVDPECTCLLDIATEQCLNCRGGAGTFTCHGCCRPFCPEHARDHRTALASNLQALIADNQRIDTSVAGGNRRRECDRARAELERWEQESIQKVRQYANDVRRRLDQVCGESEGDQTRQLMVCRERFTTRLNQAQTRNNYHERHLKYWGQFLVDLRENFSRLRGGYVQLKPCGPLIEKLCIDEKTVGIRFSKWCEYRETCLQVVDVRRTGEYRDGNCTQPIVIPTCTGAPVRPRTPTPPPPPRPRTPTPPPPPRPRSPTPPPPPPPPKICPQEQQTTEYRFCIFEDHRFIGIISKHEGSADSPLDTPSVYGWTIGNEVIRDGHRQSGNNNGLYRGDVVALLISSPERRIVLRNLTRSHTLELAIDVERCPMPWQLKVNRDEYGFH